MDRQTLTLVLQRIVNATVPYFRYGPLRSEGRPTEGAVYAWHHYYANRQPYLEQLKEWGPDPAQWPEHCPATCSTFASMVVASYLGLFEEYSSRWGRSTTKTMRGPAERYASWVARGRRLWLPDELPDHDLLRPLNVVLQRGHAWLILDCDAVDVWDPRTGHECSGLWALAADGNLFDRLGRVRPFLNLLRDVSIRPSLRNRTLLVRRYSLMPLVFEPMNERARRTRRRLARAKAGRQRRALERRVRFAICAVSAPQNLTAPHLSPIVAHGLQGDRFTARSPFRFDNPDLFHMEDPNARISER